MISYIIIAILSICLFLQTRNYLSLKKKHKETSINLIDGDSDIKISLCFNRMEMDYKLLVEQKHINISWYRCYLVGRYRGLLINLLRACGFKTSLRDEIITKYIPTFILETISESDISDIAYQEILKNHKELIKNVKLKYNLKKLNEIE